MLQHLSIAFSQRKGILPYAPEDILRIPPYNAHKPIGVTYLGVKYLV